MTHVKSFLSTVMGKIVAVLSLAGLGVAGYEAIGHKPSQGQQQTATVSSVPTSSKLIVSDETVDFQFIVAGGKNFGRVVVLNDRKNYRDMACVTVSCKPEMLGGELDPHKLVGKTISGKGKRAMYAGRPQIIADSIAVK